MEILGSLLPWIQVGLSIILVALILIQRSEAGLGSAFGGSGDSSLMHTKRGLERTIFFATIVAALLFVAAAIAALFF